MGSDLNGRNVVVTGGTGSLGRKVVQALARRGAVCHVPTRSESRESSFDGLQGVVVTPNVDPSDEDAVVAYFTTPGDLWASVHLAGGFAMAPITDTSLADWEAMMRANARTAFLCSREAVRAMRRAGKGGRIVNVAAMPALDGRRGSGKIAYAMSKAAVATLTESLDEETADEAIWVNAVVPGVLDTAANRRAMPDGDRAAWARTDDVAEVVSFLVSPDNRAVRGALVPVTGRG
jgi:NAD(P)-dependent dehydrogenase (short-subunit alcohol dehydrogenase family)